VPLTSTTAAQTTTLALGNWPNFTQGDSRIVCRT